MMGHPASSGGWWHAPASCAWCTECRRFAGDRPPLRHADCADVEARRCAEHEVVLRIDGDRADIETHRCAENEVALRFDGDRADAKTYVDVWRAGHAVPTRQGMLCPGGVRALGACSFSAPDVGAPGGGGGLSVCLRAWAWVCV